MRTTMSDAAEHRLTREEQRSRTRLAIQTAAIELFERSSFDATTIEEIAAAAGVGRRTVFRYFPCKEALLFREHLGREITPTLDRCLSEGMSPLDAAFVALRGRVVAAPTELDVRRRRVRAELLTAPSVNAYYRSGIDLLAREVTTIIREHPEHAAVPFLPELVGGVMQAIMLAHVDSGELTLQRMEDRAWRRALEVMLGARG